MPLRRFLPLLLLVWPIAEIATFIWVGGKIGILQTILLILAAGLIGTALLRLEGLRLLASIQRDMARGELPADKILQGALLAVAGLLLLLPGFLSDVPGFLLLLPPVRAAVIRLVKANAVVVTAPRAPTAAAPIRATAWSISIPTTTAPRPNRAAPTRTRRR